MLSTSGNGILLIKHACLFSSAVLKYLAGDVTSVICMVWKTFEAQRDFLSGYLRRLLLRCGAKMEFPTFSFARKQRANYWGRVEVSRDTLRSRATRCAGTTCVKVCQSALAPCCCLCSDSAGPYNSRNSHTKLQLISIAYES